MANVVEILIRARDEATAKLAVVRREFADVTRSITAVAGPLGGVVDDVVAAAGRMAGATSPFAAAAAGFAASAVIVGAAAAAASARLAKMAQDAEDVTNVAVRVAGSASDIQGLTRVLEDAGIAGSSLGVSLKFLARNIAEGDKDLAKLGVTSRNTTTALLQLGDGLASVPDPNERTRLAIQLLGRDGTALLPVLLRGSQAIRDQVDALRAQGTVLEDGVIARLAAYDDRLDEVRARMEGVTNQLAVAALPAFEALSGILIALLTTLNSLPEKIAGVGTALRNLANRIPGGKQALDALAVANAIARLADAKERLAKADTTALGRIGASEIVGPPVPPPPGTPGTDPLAKQREALADALRAEQRAAVRQFFPEKKDEITLRVVGTSAAALKASLEALAKTMQTAAETHTQVTAAGLALARFPLDIGTLTDALETNFAFTLRETLNTVLTDTQNFKNVMTSLWRSILNDLKSALVDSFLEASGTREAIKGLAGAIVSFVGGIFGFGGGLTSGSPFSPALLSGGGGVTLNVSALDSRSFTDQLVSPNGSARLAFERAERLRRA